MSGKWVRPLGDQPSRMSASQPPTPEVLTAMRTSLESGTATGSVLSESASDPPKRSIAAACMFLGMACSAELLT
jgi:hypothetical protein